MQPELDALRNLKCCHAAMYLQVIAHWCERPCQLAAIAMPSYAVASAARSAGALQGLPALRTAAAMVVSLIVCPDEVWLLMRYAEGPDLSLVLHRSSAKPEQALPALRCRRQQAAWTAIAEQHVTQAAAS